MTPTQQVLIRLAYRWPRRNPLKARLERQGRTDWLEIGGFGFDQGFRCMGITDPADISEQHRDRYTKLNLLEQPEAVADHEAAYDLIRMQHVFEHFGPEDGVDVLRMCARMLKPGGYLLMTTPDLALSVNAYRQRFRWILPNVKKYHRSRIPDDAPPCFNFSMIAHQYGYSRIDHDGEQHCWCYDYEGLAYQVNRAGGFAKPRRLGLLHPLASIPFTHNRAGQEVCILAQRA